MTPQELKKSIIQLSLKGQLTNHVCSDSVDDLLNYIQNTREKLIKQGLTKRAKLPTPFDETPFDLPDNWKWVRLSEIAYVNGGYAFKSADYKEKGIRIIRISDFNEFGFVNSKIVRQEYKEEFEPYLLSNEDILLCMTGGTVGKSYFVEAMSEPMVTNQRVATIKIINPCKKYINYVILSPFVQKIIQDSKNSTNDNISMDTIYDFPVPLPPLEEQKRIVNKIEELLPLVNRYEEAWNKLEKFNNEFPSDMELSIIKHALQGKLVEQNESEGTGFALFDKICEVKKELINKKIIKKDKAIEPIAEDDLPFEIPSSWKWAYLGEIFLHNTGKAQNSSGSTNGTIRKFITTSNLYWNKFDFSKIKEMPFTDAELERCTVKKGDLLVCEGGDCGRSAIWNYDEEMCIQNHVHRLRPYYGLDINFYYYMMFYYKNARLLRGRGVAIQGLSNEAIHKVVCPLPPYEEQKRIVAKLEELLPLCRKLVK